MSSTATGSDAPAAAPALHPALTPREWHKPWIQPFLNALATMPNVSAACRQAGIHRDTAYNERTINKDFDIAWAEAREIGLDLAEQIVYRRGTTGEPRARTRTRIRRNGDGDILEQETTTDEETVISNQMLILWLKANRPSRWADRIDHRHGGHPDGIPIRHQAVSRARTPERLAALLELALESGMLQAKVGDDGVARIEAVVLQQETEP